MEEPFMIELSDAVEWRTSARTVPKGKFMFSRLWVEGLVFGLNHAITCFLYAATSSWFYVIKGALIITSGWSEGVKFEISHSNYYLTKMADIMKISQLLDHYSHETYKKKL